jgi:hypothetical protein
MEGEKDIIIEAIILLLHTSPNIQLARQSTLEIEEVRVTKGVRIKVMHAHGSNQLEEGAGQVVWEGMHIFTQQHLP